MDNGFTAAIVCIFLTGWLTYEATSVRWDTLVSDIPIKVNFEMCEKADSKLESWDKITATCENGFTFDLIKGE